MQARSRIRWLVLGTGFISATIVHAINNSETGIVVAVGTRKLENARRFAEEHSIPNFSDNLDELITANFVDAVYISLPNHLHATYTIKAAKAGKHILCEKPFTTSVADAAAVIAEVEAANVICMEALMYRCHPLTKKLVSLVDSGVIGEIKAFHASYVADIPPNKVEGGALRNLGCYPISLIRLLAKAEPVSVTAIGTLSHDFNVSDTHSNVIMNFSNNSSAYITVIDKGRMEWVFVIEGTKGNIRLPTNPWLPNEGENIIQISSQRSDQDWQNISVNSAKPLYSYQIDAVGKAIAGDRSELISMQDSLANVAVVEACRKMVMEQHLLIRLDAGSDRRASHKRFFSQL